MMQLAIDNASLGTTGNDLVRPSKRQTRFYSLSACFLVQLFLPVLTSQYWKRNNYFEMYCFGPAKKSGPKLAV